MEELIDTKRAAALLSMCESTVRKYTCMRLIPFIKIGASVRFRPSELERWVEGRRVSMLGERASR